MSWRVRNLILNSINIKSNPDLESDDYNDFLLIEKAFTNLDNNGYISDKEKSILREILISGTFKAVSRKLNLNKKTVSRIYRVLCNKIAFYLGGEFTDDGYIEYMAEKYNLTDDKVSKLKEIISGKYEQLYRKRSKN